MAMSFFSGIRGLNNILIALLLVSAVPCYAQSFNYIDEAGTVHFVESLSEVPPRYRDQVVPPTPITMTPKEYKKYLSEIEKKKKDEEKLKKSEEKAKARLKEKKKREMQEAQESERKKQRKLAQEMERKRGGAPAPSGK